MRALIRITIIPFFVISSYTHSQTLLLEENFNYGVSSGDLSTLTSDWSSHSGETGDKVQYSTVGLTFSGYPSAIGGSALVNGGSGTREDINSTFTNTNSGNIYLSFIINITNATSGSGDYNVHFGSSTASGRLFIKEDGSNNVSFGISKKEDVADASFSDFDYSLNTNYVIVLKYSFNSGSNNDDVSLFIFSENIPTIEPSATVSHLTEITSDISAINAVSLRQGTISNTFSIDGIRVSDSWSQAPLPVELISFNAATSNYGVILNWETATETNNYGFEIERMIHGMSEWLNIGFVQGNGNSNSPKRYQFIDFNAPLGKLKYRLKQIDTDGSFIFYGLIAEVSNGVIATVQRARPNDYSLYQNYPNPFNSSTTIKFALPQSTPVQLSIYNIAGEKIKEAVNRILPKGSHSFVFDASTLNSGVYFYRIKTSDFVSVKTMYLLK